VRGIDLLSTDFREESGQLSERVMNSLHASMSSPIHWAGVLQRRLDPETGLFDRERHDRAIVHHGDVEPERIVVFPHEVIQFDHVCEIARGVQSGCKSVLIFDIFRHCGRALICG